MLKDGSAIPFDRVALATGATPRLPPVAGIDLAGVYTLRHAADARRLRDALFAANDVVVVGGGFIGLEIAGTARLLGKTVTVLEAADRLMGRVVAPEISQHFLALHRGWGSDVRLATAVGGIIGEGGRVVAVATAAGDRIPADIAVIGIGVTPNMGLAEAAGATIDNGILVNDFMETSVPGLFAVGDCVSFDHWELKRRVRLESVQNAVDQAKRFVRGADRQARALSRGAVVLVGPGRRQAADGGALRRRHREPSPRQPGRRQLFRVPLCGGEAGGDRFGQPR